MRRITFQTTAARRVAPRTAAVIRPNSPMAHAMQWHRPAAKEVRIRAVRHDDRERIAAAFDALDAQSVYRRFFGPKKVLTARELRWLTEPDEDRKLVLVATTGRHGEESVVGLAQYVRSGDQAEVAFIVADRFQGLGIASRMLRRLVDIARHRGIARFEAEVLADNAAMLHVFRRSRLAIEETEADGVVRVTLALPGRAVFWRAPSRTVWQRIPMGIVSGTMALLTAVAPTAEAADAEALARSRECFSCHRLDTETAAPSFRLLARNYGRIPNADYVLARVVQRGGMGHWGAEPMPPAGARPAVSESEAKELVAWIFTLK